MRVYNKQSKLINEKLKAYRRRFILVPFSFYDGRKYCSSIYVCTDVLYLFSKFSRIETYIVILFPIHTFMQALNAFNQIEST